MTHPGLLLYNIPRLLPTGVIFFIFAIFLYSREPNVMFSKYQFFRLLRYILFWMIFFWFDKIIFLIYNLEQSAALNWKEIAGIFFYGSRMDISTSCYLIALPALLLLFRHFIPAGFINRFVRIYTIAIIVVSSLLIAFDLGLYPHWGTRVNATIFNYIDEPQALAASVSLAVIGITVLMVLIISLFFSWLYSRFLPKGIVVEGKIRPVYFPIEMFVVASLIIPIRGGLDTSPLNLSSVAFSKNLYVNQAAANFLWNFGNSIDKMKRLVNPCNYMSHQESEKLFTDFMKTDTIVPHPQLVRLNPEQQPNVILIILESFSDKVISKLGGKYGVTPNLDSLCTKSTVFTRFYSTGNRSDRGISAILGGYPSLLSTSIMVYPEKCRSLTLLPEYFDRKDYSTSFYYGGDINFYNLKTFVLQSKYDKVVSKTDFPIELGLKQKWGVPDGYVLERALEDMKTESEPFMKTIYTLSSHPPFDVPFSKIKGHDIQDEFLNSVAYTDSCLGQFFDGLRKSPFWKNTLLIVTADHGNLQPGPTDITDTASYRIPLIWSGGVIDSVRQINTIAMQSDLGTTLIHQLGWKTDSARFSHDFFVSKPRAFYMLDSGWGYITPSGCYYFDINANDFVRKPAGGKNAGEEKFAKAYLQALHEDFIKR